MLVMDVIAEILKREGISTLFCFPTTPIIEAAAAVGIKPVICRQERVGVHMANGFARVSNGRPPGVFAMQYGPGAENAFAGVATAFSDSSPVVFLPLGHPRETAQLFPMFKSSRSYAAITKSVEEVILPEQIANVMRRAFSQVKNGRQGPVMVEVPADVHSIRCRCRSERVPAGSRHPLGRRRPRHRGGGAPAARRLLPDDPRRAGRLLCRSHRRVAAVGRTAAGAGHDDLRRQERLSGGPRIGARARRRHLYRARPAFPAQIGSGAGRRLQLYQAWHRHPRIAVRQEDHPSRPTIRATCTRPLPPILGISATPSSCSAN